MSYIKRLRASGQRKKVTMPIVAIFVLGFSGSIQYTSADQFIADDLIVDGSICIGLDCVNGENFNFDTIRLKENNVRIKFQDTSSTGGFPNVDWQLTANDSSNGGDNYFAIEDITNSRVPFKVSAGAPNNSIYVRNNGYVGFNTNTPAVTLQVTNGNTPTLRLDQDGSSGFSAQAWDVGGNETNFFVRDVNNSSNLPLRIRAGAPTGALYVDTDGDIGLGTTSPDGLFDIAHPADANNHSVLVSSLGNVGINIDNGQTVNSLFEIQSTGGVSEFSVSSTGNTTINGNVGVTGDATFNSNIYVKDSGQFGVGTNYFNVISEVVPKIKTSGSTHSGIVINSADPNYTGSLIFTKQDSPMWYLASRNDYSNAGESFVIYNKNLQTVMSIYQDKTLGIGTGVPVAGRAINTSTGAYLTTGGVWTNSSSRELKKDILELPLNLAKSALKNLSPVTYEYTAEPGETYVGFIAEDVPELVATNGRKNMSPMDVVAVLTKVVQDQQKTIDSLNERLISIERNDTQTQESNIE